MKIYSIEEANFIIPKIRPILKEIKLKSLDYSKYHIETSRLVVNFRGSPYDKDGILDKIIFTRKELRRLFSELESYSVILRDIDSGTVDFPSNLDGDEVMLCCRVFEETSVEWWHGIQESCNIRKPIKKSKI